MRCYQPIPTHLYLSTHLSMCASIYQSSHVSTVPSLSTHRPIRPIPPPRSTCGSLDHFLMVSSGMPAASSTLPNGSSAIATPSQLVRSARPSNGDADACTALSPPLHGAFSPSFSQSAAMMPRSAPSGASLGSVGPRTEPRKSSHLDGQRRWRRRPWAGQRAPPHPLSGAQASRAQPQASGRA